MIYLESFIAYYKHATNIDAYPMILDLALIKDAETLLDTVDKVALSYGGVELFGIAPDQNLNTLFLIQIKKSKLMKCFQKKILY